MSSMALWKPWKQGQGIIVRHSPERTRTHVATAEIHFSLQNIHLEHGNVKSGYHVHQKLIVIV